MKIFDRWEEDDEIGIFSEPKENKKDNPKKIKEGEIEKLKAEITKDVAPPVP